MFFNILCTLIVLPILFAIIMFMIILIIGIYHKLFGRDRSLIQIKDWGYKYYFIEIIGKPIFREIIRGFCGAVSTLQKK